MELPLPSIKEDVDVVELDGELIDITEVDMTPEEEAELEEVAQEMIQQDLTTLKKKIKERVAEKLCEKGVKLKCPSGKPNCDCFDILGDDDLDDEEVANEILELSQQALNEPDFMTSTFMTEIPDTDEEEEEKVELGQIELIDLEIEILESRLNSDDTTDREKIEERIKDLRQLKNLLVVRTHLPEDIVSLIAQFLSPPP